MDPLATLWTPLIPYARYLVSLGRGVTATSGLRTYAEQARLYNQFQALLRQGLTPDQIAKTYGLYTPLPPGRSMHQYGLAFDVGGPADELARLGAIWNSWGGLWSASDRVHFQVRTS